MRLHILSDLHLEHASFEMPLIDSDVLLFAGDINAPTPDRWATSLWAWGHLISDVSQQPVTGSIATFRK